MKGLRANPDERWQKVGEMVSEIREAEARLVKLAREAAARAAGSAPAARPAANPPAPLPPAAAPASPIASSAPSAAKPESTPRPPRPAATPSKKRKSNPDDDIDLTAMFAE
jgi:hypothetical protein